MSLAVMQQGSGTAMLRRPSSLSSHSSQYSTSSLLSSSSLSSSFSSSHYSSSSSSSFNPRSLLGTPPPPPQTPPCPPSQVYVSSSSTILLGEPLKQSSCSDSSPYLPYGSRSYYNASLSSSSTYDSTPLRSIHYEGTIQEHQEISCYLEEGATIDEADAAGHYEAIYEAINELPTPGYEKQYQTPTENPYAVSHCYEDSFESDDDQAYCRLQPPSVEEEEEESEIYGSETYSSRGSGTPQRKLADAANSGMKKLRKNWTQKKSEVKTGFNKIKNKSSFSQSEAKSTENIYNDPSPTSEEKRKWSFKNHFARRTSASSLSSPPLALAPTSKEKDTATFYLTLTIESDKPFSNRKAHTLKDVDLNRLDLISGRRDLKNVLEHGRISKVGVMERPKSSTGSVDCKKATRGHQRRMPSKPARPKTAPPAPPSEYSGEEDGMGMEQVDLPKDKLALRLNQILSSGQPSSKGRKVLRSSEDSNASPVPVLVSADDISSSSSSKMKKNSSNPYRYGSKSPGGKRSTLGYSSSGSSSKSSQRLNTSSSQLNSEDRISDEYNPSVYRKASNSRCSLASGASLTSSDVSSIPPPLPARPLSHHRPKRYSEDNSSCGTSVPQTPTSVPPTPTSVPHTPNSIPPTPTSNILPNPHSVPSTSSGSPLLYGMPPLPSNLPPLPTSLPPIPSSLPPYTRASIPPLGDDFNRPNHLTSGSVPATPTSTLHSPSRGTPPLSYESQDPSSPSDTSASQEPLYVSSKFADEPLYQFYTARVLERARRGDCSSEDDYEVINEGMRAPPPSRPTAMEIVTPADGRRSLWCELPEVVSSGVLASLNSCERKVQEAMFEVITSEASYLKSLEVLVSNFLNCEAFGNEAIITKREKNVLFSDILPVKRCSEMFLADLESRWQESAVISTLADVVLKHASNSFGVYVKYCSNQIYQDRMLKSLKENKPRFIEVLNELESSSVCQSLAMHSFLMLPMQRITRLPLLLDNIFHRLERGSPHWHQCNLALATLNKVVTECNEGARRMERMEEMLIISRQIDFREVKAVPLISASRWLVKKGELTRLIWRDNDGKLTFGKRISKHTLYFFLFTDLLVVTKKKSDDSYTVLDHCPRNMVQVLELNSCEKSPNRWLDGHKNLLIVTMLQNHESKTVEMVLSCALESERTRWVEAVTPRTSDNPDEQIYEEWDCPQVQAVHPYSGGQPDELSLEVSDVVNVLKKMADGWYQGERLRDGERGWFPGSYCKEIASAHVRARNLRQRYRLLAMSETMVEELRKHAEEEGNREERRERRKTVSLKDVIYSSQALK